MIEKKLICSEFLGSSNNYWLRQIPFLPSESIEILDETATGSVCLTSFRLILYCKHQENIISIPTLLIRLVESSSLVHMCIVTKIGKVFTCQFKSVLACEAWVKHINAVLESPKNFSQTFAFRFQDVLKRRDVNHPFLIPVKETLDLGVNDTTFEAQLVLHEFTRMGFNSNWKITDINSDFKICSSYPKYHIMPRDISDQVVPSMATFRSHNRFPSVVWRSRRTGAVLLRCAQPCVGIMCSRNEVDERFVGAVLENCKRDPQTRQNQEDSFGLLIIDARNYSAAQFNRLRGGGFEYMEYYDQSEIRFMELPNLHAVRLSFERLILLYRKPDSNWYSALERTMWLTYISQLLKAACEVVAGLDVKGRPVMVHCTDGWDRTPQLTSLAQILLDPYYRTIQGFRILVEREWLQFGHKFADRCGHSLRTCSPEEQSPIFLQWLDCVRQVQRQFPSYFEFNEFFLIKMAIHTYSGLFGTFLYNSELERQAAHCASQTCSIWAFLNPKHNWSIYNYLYEEKLEVINPAWHVRSLELWDSLYVNALLPSNTTPPLSQPPALTTPFRRSSDTPVPLQISTSCFNAASSLGVLSSGPPTTSIASTLSSVAAGTNASSLDETSVPLRSQSMCSINLASATVPSAPSPLPELTIKPVPPLRGASLELVYNDQTQASRVAQCSLSPVYSKLSKEDEKARVAAVDADDSALKCSLSDQALSMNVADDSPLPGQVRSSSAPFSSLERKKSTRGFRLSSLGDNETIVVNDAPLDEIRDAGDAEGLDSVTVTTAAEAALDRIAVSKSFIQTQTVLPSSFSPTAWSSGYFNPPVFSTTYRKLTDESVSLGENGETVDKSSVPSSSNHAYEGSVSKVVSDNLFNQNQSRTGNDLQHGHSTSNNIKRDTESGVPNLTDSNLNLTDTLLDAGASSGRHLDMGDSNFPTDLDGLPLRIDTVTAKLHQRHRQEARASAEHQCRIDRLEAEIANLKVEMARLRELTTKTNEVVTRSADYAYQSAFPQSTPSLVATAQNGYANRPMNQPSSIAEALTDAIDSQQPINGCNSCGDVYETVHGALLDTQPATDDGLLNWSEGFVSTATLPRRHKYGPSTSSDVSSFDVVERSAVPSCSGSGGEPVCDGFDYTVGCLISPSCGFVELSIRRNNSCPRCTVCHTMLRYGW
uniref:Myotubularin phosphatase domain-containing protein n=1 Tax=Mesocestoides corti TaxID=53468 RepID=A0A5K3EYZ4_MESCO